MPKWIPILALLLAVCFITTVGGVVSTDKEIRRYLGIQDYVGIVPEHVKAAVIEYIPIGSSERQVQRALAAKSIGVDNGSVCEANGDRGELTCQLGIHHHFWELLRETYTISFAFDASGALRKVSVRSALSWV
ncbi:MAG: hypothetical protein JWO80_2407 [Bryobacterales bacterium]|nr:hypothetical protein [Bryobacterales bacterium]